MRTLAAGFSGAIVFPIYDVSNWPKGRPETLGSKEKTWLFPDRQLDLPVSWHLFKVGRPNTGENWAEKVCCEILKALDISCADYDFAIRNGTHGVISASFLPPGASLVLANVLLSKFDPAYDGSLKFHQPRYTLSSALDLVRTLGLQPPPGAAQVFAGMAGYEIFVGYLLFDALIGNTDRHHENWGAVLINGARTIAGGAEFCLAPSFDHASSLGRDLTDLRRQERLNTRDKRASPEAYAERGRSAFYGDGQPGRPLTGRQVVETLLRAFPGPTRFWSEKLVDLDQSRFSHIFEQVPREIISEYAVQFALRMLACNQQMIREVVLAD
jgi:hypothetical protein